MALCLSTRYFGIALEYAVALGFCAVFGALLRPISGGQFDTIVGPGSVQGVLLGVAVCLVSMAASGVAGRSKEPGPLEAQKKATVQEFNFFVKGVAVAVFCGITGARVRPLSRDLLAGCGRRR